MAPGQRNIQQCQGFNIHSGLLIDRVNYTAFQNSLVSIWVGGVMKSKGELVGSAEGEVHRAERRAVNEQLIYHEES